MNNAIKIYLTSVLTTFGIGLIIMLVNLIIIGEVYWLYSSYKIGSFWMGLIGISPLGIFTAPIGLYSLFFGMPNWLMLWFL